MEFTHIKMVFCSTILADDSRHSRLLSFDIFEQEINDEQLKNQLNTTNSLNLKDAEAEEIEEYAISCQYRIIDVMINESGNIFADVKDLEITVVV